mmetsp:Transcript_20523/g.69567  ORF Transcript_20523/g.69567 Transcript_20523/m.69567 type:complete len:304 (-) Transcript_20523:226-1137(-)
MLDAKWGMACRMVHGVPYIGGISVAVVDALRGKFLPAKTDVFVATYPKCGTTWMQQICVLLLNGGQTPVDLQKSAPWIERQGTSGTVDIDKLNSPAGRRVFKTHAPFALAPYKAIGDAKVIYVARNAKDACVSAFFHNRSIPPHHYDGPWDNFVDLYLEGKIEHGSWFDHHRDWWAAYQKDPEHILWVFYEDLQRDPRETIKRVAEFLEVEATDDLLDSVVRGSSFQAMKDQDKVFNFHTMPLKKVDGKQVSHFRVGKSAGWRDSFSAQQSTRFDRALFDQLKGCTGLSFDMGLGQSFHAPGN